MYGKTYRFPLYHQLPYIRIALFWPCASHFQTHQDQGCESFPAACRRQKWGLSQQIDSHKGVTYLQLCGSCNSHLFYIIYIYVYYIILGRGASLYNLVPCKHIVEWKQMIRLEWCVPLGHPGVTKGSLVSELINFEVAFICFQT
jgi:hypothetical protein